jgi:SAM-dependent MidA family methyltransferase
MMASLPRPDRHALAVSASLTTLIRTELERAGGWLDFAEFMRRALYEPGLGYYSAGSRKFGSGGDFVTAPELGSLLGESLARHLAALLGCLDEPVIVEFGAGTGKLARDVLLALRRECLRPRYRIVEPSGDLGGRQRELLASFGDQVSWLERWPGEPFDGVVLANEMLDALPVSRFVKRGSAIRALGVTWRRERFAWAEAEADPRLVEAVLDLERALGRTLEDGFQSEICFALPTWFEALEPLRRGFVLALDYGLARREYYHPTRAAGTLICHYRHRAHGDPFLFPGLQDLSAWVDFSACRDAAEAAGLTLGGFTTQGQFLLESGVHELLEGERGRNALRRTQELATLVLPGQMGERFKVMQLARGVDEAPALPGRDFSDRL